MEETEKLILCLGIMEEKKILENIAYHVAHRENTDVVIDVEGIYPCTKYEDK